MEAGTAHYSGSGSVRSKVCSDLQQVSLQGGMGGQTSMPCWAARGHMEKARLGRQARPLAAAQPTHLLFQG